MQLTQLEQAYKQAIEELNLINGRVYVLNSFMNQTKERILNDERIGRELITSGLSFRDITLNKDADNLFYSTNHYSLNRNNLEDEVNMILSREYLFQVSQAYEILETYLYNQVAEFIRLKSNFNLFIDSRSMTNSFTSIRKALKGLNDRTNNRHLLAILRSNSSSFAKFETENIYDLNFQQWFDLLSEIRHCTTHSRMVVSDSIRIALPKFSTQYAQIKQYNNSDVLFIDQQNCQLLISLIADYMSFIIKVISEECGHWEVDFFTLQQILNDRFTTEDDNNQTLP